MESSFTSRYSRDGSPSYSNPGSSNDLSNVRQTNALFLLIFLRSFLSCCSDTSPEELFALRCRHQHCLDCWQAYLGSNIVLTGCTQSISCMSRCNQVIDDEQILVLLEKNPDLCQRYQRFLLDAYVDSNRLTRWCPGNGCSIIVKMKTYSPKCAQLIECDTCKTNFCFQCSKQWHAPIQCSIIDKWEQKNKDESMTGKWIMASK